MSAARPSHGSVFSTKWTDNVIYSSTSAPFTVILAILEPSLIYSMKNDKTFPVLNVAPSLYTSSTLTVALDEPSIATVINTFVTFPTISNLISLL